MTTAASRQPFEDLGWDDRHSAPEALRSELDLMRTMLDRALGRNDDRPAADPGDGTAWVPTLDISERGDAYLVAVELPGVEPDDFQVTVEDGLLIIEGERHFAHDSSERRFRIERRYGRFRRAITLRADVVADGIQATIVNGVLQIMVPKAAGTKLRRIEVRAGQVAVPSTNGQAAAGKGTAARG